jgi:hypothetical protein
VKTFLAAALIAFGLVLAYLMFGRDREPDPGNYTGVSGDWCAENGGEYVPFPGGDRPDLNFCIIR